jgi:hypothetical protein
MKVSQNDQASMSNNSSITGLKGNNSVSKSSVKDDNANFSTYQKKIKPETPNV